MRTARCPARGCRYPNSVQLDLDAVGLRVKFLEGATAMPGRRLDGLERLWVVEKSKPVLPPPSIPDLTEALFHLWTASPAEPAPLSHWNYEIDQLGRAVLDALD